MRNADGSAGVEKRSVSVCSLKLFGEEITKKPISDAHQSVALLSKTSVVSRRTARVADGTDSSARLFVLFENNQIATQVVSSPAAVFPCFENNIAAARDLR